MLGEDVKPFPKQVCIFIKAIKRINQFVLDNNDFNI
jgi:hypothetical protein